MKDQSHFVSFLVSDFIVSIRSRRYKDQRSSYLIVQLDIVEENLEEDVGHADQRVVLLQVSLIFDLCRPREF